VSSRLPTREQARELLQKSGCPSKVIRHCEEVANVALDVAHELQNKGVKVDLQLVETGALLHDIGRSKTHSVDHGLAGSQIAEAANVPEPVINIIKRHVGGGITSKEAKEFGWPEDNYVPVTLEEKIVCYADKLTDKSKRVSIDVEIERLNKQGFTQAAERIRKLHEEITSLINS